MEAEDTDGFFVPSGRGRYEETIRRSRFVTTLERAATADAARALVDRIRADSDAAHHRWAFVAGPPGETAHIGSSDAGEPSGTAGRPMLQVLLHSGVGEVAAVVTRYFGGTKLGTGGLARAYASGVKNALDDLATELKVIRIALTLEVSYAEVDALRRLMDECGATAGRESYAARVRVVCAVPRDRLAAFESGFADLTRGGGLMSRD